MLILSLELYAGVSFNTPRLNSKQVLMKQNQVLLHVFAKKHTQQKNREKSAEVKPSTVTIPVLLTYSPLPSPLQDI